MGGTSARMPNMAEGSACNVSLFLRACGSSFLLIYGDISIYGDTSANTGTSRLQVCTKVGHMPDCARKILVTILVTITLVTTGVTITLSGSINRSRSRSHTVILT
jgi:hypothetical protein